MHLVQAYWKSTLWSIFIIYVSLIKEYNLQLLPDFSWRDKLLHACAYCILGLLLGIELKACQICGKRYWLWLIITPICLGGLIEILQEYCFPPRVGDWWDFAANSFGVILATLICKIFVTK